MPVMVPGVLGEYRPQVTFTEDRARCQVIPQWPRPRLADEGGRRSGTGAASPVGQSSGRSDVASGVSSSAARAASWGLRSTPASGSPSLVPPRSDW